MSKLRCFVFVNQEALNNSVIVIGGGLGGLLSALHLSKRGLDVTLIEKHKYPRHKVCGEYISNEVLPYLKSLGFDPFFFGAKDIKDFTLSTPQGRYIKAPLPLGGFSISRYRIDAELAKLAKAKGTRIIHETVQNIEFQNDQFVIYTNLSNTYRSDLVIGSFGKRSNLDIKLNRAFMKKKSPFLAVKAHYIGDFPEDAVGLHNFESGYCGVSKVENDHINICYITDYESFKRYKDISEFQSKVVSKNTFLKKVFDEYEMAFEKPLTISQISFAEKNPVENNILMCGDSAGMIHPLAGNGMGMAIRSAQMLSELILAYENGAISSRGALEQEYTRAWREEFSVRLRSGHIIARLFRLGIFSELIMILLKLFPFILPFVIRRTHGKTMQPAK